MSSGSHKASAHRQSRKKPKSRRSPRRRLHAASGRFPNKSDWMSLLADSELKSQFDSIREFKTLPSEFLNVVLNSLTSSFLGLLDDIDPALLSDSEENIDNPIAAVLAQLKDILPDSSDDNAVQNFRAKLGEKFRNARDLMREQLLSVNESDSLESDSGVLPAVLPDAVQDRIAALLQSSFPFDESQISELVQELGYQMVQNAVQAYAADIPNLEDVLRDDERLKDDPELLAFIHALESPDSNDESNDADDSDIDSELLASALEALLDDIDLS